MTFNAEMKLVTTIFIFIQLGELLCYIHLNCFIFNHNHKMMSTSVISSDTFKRRQRSHVFSMTGQMNHFLAELGYWILLNLTFFFRDQGSSTDFLELATYVKLTNFGIISSVQVLSTPELRAEFLSFIENFYRL